MPTDPDPEGDTGKNCLVGQWVGLELELQRLSSSSTLQPHSGVQQSLVAQHAESAAVAQPHQASASVDQPDPAYQPGDSEARPLTKPHRTHTFGYPSLVFFKLISAGLNLAL